MPLLRGAQKKIVAGTPNRMICFVPSTIAREREREMLQRFCGARVQVVLK